MLSRRGLLIGGAAAVGVGVGVGVVGGTVAPPRFRSALGLAPDPFIPDAPEGQVRLERVRSAAMGGDLDLFTAVPAGHGSGHGLPVVVVLHGSSASAADFRDFGLARFVTAAVQAGAPPFVLAGTDDGPVGWVPDGAVDPQAMLREELPQWLADRGHDVDRRALWGWSRGGYGALRFSLTDPDWCRATALFSPAVDIGDPTLADLEPVAGLPLAVWCGEDDAFHDDVVDLVGRLPVRPEVVTYGNGGHTRVYWNSHTLEAFDWLARKAST